MDLKYLTPELSRGLAAAKRRQGCWVEHIVRHLKSPSPAQPVTEVCVRNVGSKKQIEYFLTAIYSRKNRNRNYCEHLRSL